MKEFPIHIISLIGATLLHGSVYASPVVDSLPACILKMKQKDSLLIMEEYDYKGQRWFGIRSILTEQKMKKVGYIKTIIFYNLGCNTVATWRTGGNGIVKIDKILPDTIDKTKIIQVAEKVPEKIMQLATNNNSISITEYEYLGQTLYFLNKSKNYNTPQTPVVRAPYYDKNGKEIITFQRATRGAFLKAQYRDPYDVDTKKLIKKGIIWYDLPKE